VCHLLADAHKITVLLALGRVLEYQYCSTGHDTNSMTHHGLKWNSQTGSLSFATKGMIVLAALPLTLASFRADREPKDKAACGKGRIGLGKFFEFQHDNWQE
jgi:hypothetical protein